MNNANRSLLSVLMIAALLGAAGCSREAKRDRHFGRAEKYFASEQYEKAIIEYRNVLRLDPTNRTALLRVARIFFEQGSPVQAMQAMQAADPHLESDDPALRCRLAEFRLATGDTVRGRNELLDLLAQSPTNSDALRLLAGPGTPSQELTNTTVYLEQLDAKHPNSAAVLLARAALLTRQRQLDTAEQFVQRALQLDPNQAQAHVQMGQIHLLRTNLAAADEAFGKAVKLAPPRSPVHTAYAQSKMVSGKPDEARALLEDVLSQAPDYLPAALLLARLEMQDKRLDEALALTGRIVSKDPLNIEARQLRTELHRAKGQPEKAALEWEQFDQSVRPNPFIKLQVARAHLSGGDSVKAGAALDQAIIASSNRLDTVAIEARLLRARLHVEGRTPAVAVESLQRLLSITNVLEARILLIDAQRGAGRLDEAVATCQGLIRDHPDRPAFPLMLGMLLREQGRMADARNAFRRELELSPGSLMALYQLVDLEIAATNAPAALKTVQTELARTNSAALKYLEGRALAAQRLWPQAQASLEESIGLNPQFSLAYQLLADIHIANTNLAGAARQLEELISKKTNDVQSMAILGTLYERMDQPEQARAKYERILEINPQFVPALNNLAYLYTERLPQLERAHELAQKARQLVPEDPSVMDTLAWVLHKRGEDQQALPLLREAAQRVPGNAEIQYHLGMVSYMLGQPDAARAALERAVAAPQSFPSKAEAQRQLALLTSGSAAGGTEDRATLEARVKDQPRDLTARSRLAAVYEQEGQFPKAAAEYEEILRQNPKAAQASLRLAELNAGPLNDQAKALEIARKAHELAPNDPQAAGLLGRLLARRGDHVQAYGLLQSAAQRSPQQADLQYDYAWAAYAMGRVADAHQAMRRALEIQPDFQAADAARGFVAMTALALDPRGLAQAEPQIREVLKADLDHVPALMAQAALFRARADGKSAATLYERVLRVFPRFAPASRELGLVLAGDPAQGQRAYDLLSRTREAFPDDGGVARALALLSYARKDYRYTTTLLESYVRRQPDDSEALFYLGMAQCQIKQTDQGKEQLRKAIAAGLKEPLLAEAKKALAAPSSQ